MKTKVFGLEIDTEAITLQQKIIAGVVVAVLAVGLFGYYWVTPVMSEYMALSQETAQLRAERDAKKAQVKRIDVLKKESDELNAQIEILSRAIPKRENIPILLIDIEKMGNKSSSALTSFKPGAPRPYSGLPAPSPADQSQSKSSAATQKTSLEARLKEIPLTLTARANYTNLIKLFNSFENYERVVKITNVSLSPSKSVTPGKASPFDSSLDVSLDVTSYVLEEGAK